MVSAGCGEGAVTPLFFPSRHQVIPIRHCLWLGWSVPSCGALQGSFPLLLAPILPLCQEIVSQLGLN